MKTLILILGAVILGSCHSATTDVVSSDSTSVVDSIKIDSTKVVDTLKK